MEDRKDNKEVSLQLPSQFTHSTRLLLAFVFFFEVFDSNFFDAFGLKFDVVWLGLMIEIS